jgi:hypothetical protein
VSLNQLGGSEIEKPISETYKNAPEREIINQDNMIKYLIKEIIEE